MPGVIVQSLLSLSGLAGKESATHRGFFDTIHAMVEVSTTSCNVAP